MKEVYGLGYFLNLKKPFIQVRSELGVDLFNPNDTLILSGVGLLSVKAIKYIKENKGSLALRRGFNVQYLHYNGSLYNKLLIQQLRIHDDLKKSFHIARKIVYASSLNKISILESFSIEDIDVRNEISIINDLLDIKVASISDLRQIEARIAHQYFNALKKVIDEKYGFEARTRRPPKDYFSAALSYSNTILYKYVETTVKCLGLEPRIGYLHEPFRKRVSLALDLAEQFRQPIVDSTILPFFISGSMRLKIDFNKRGEAIYLSSKGRKKILSSLRKKLNLKLGKYTFLEHIWNKVEEFSKYIQGLIDEYEPFTIYKYRQS